MTPAGAGLIPAPHPQPLLIRAEAAMGAAVDATAALLVLIEIVVLLAGVVSRFVFDAPLVWTDELASSLFLWLAMLGSVLAARRSVHMRMSALTSLMAPCWRTFFEALGLATAAAFLLLLVLPAVDYAIDQNFITTPAMGIPDSWRAAALPAGVGLMLLVALLRLTASARPLTVGAAVLTVAAVAAALWLAGPALVPLGRINLLIFFVGGVSLMVFAGVPIAFCFGLTTVAYLSVTTRLPLTMVVGRMDGGMSQLILLAVPLFVFLGALLEMTGMADVMVRFLSSMLGHVRGGLNYVLVGAMYLISGVSAAKAADMAAVAPVLFPEMQRRGARGGDLVALLAATGAQTETVPPSLVLITIGSVTGVSIGALFTARLLPSALLAAVLCGLVWWRHRGGPAPTVKRAGWQDVVRLLAIAAPALVLPFIVRFAVMGK